MHFADNDFRSASLSLAIRDFATTFEIPVAITASKSSMVLFSIMICTMKRPLTYVSARLRDALQSVGDQRSVRSVLLDIHHDSGLSGSTRVAGRNVGDEGFSFGRDLDVLGG